MNKASSNVSKSKDIREFNNSELSSKNSSGRIFKEDKLERTAPKPSSF